MTEKLDLQERVALVTGASRGIGYHVAKKLAAAGAHVIAVARTVGGLEELDDEIQAAGGQATPSTYRGADGNQYLVVVAGGHGSTGTRAGDHIIAYRLGAASPSQ